MQYLKQFWIGMRAFFKAFRFIFQNHLYWYFVPPAFLMLGIYYMGDLINNHQADYQMNTINDIVWYTLRILIEMTIAILLMKFAKYMVVVILSPMLSFLSQKCEKVLTGKTYPFSRKQLWHDIQRSFRIVVRNLMWEYTFFLVIFIVSILGWKDAHSAPIFYLTFAIGFFYYGFSFLDYVNERRKLDIDESIIFIRKHRGLAVAIGGIYSLLILMPVDLSVLFEFATKTKVETSIGTFFTHLSMWLLASMAPVVTIVAATIAMHDLGYLKADDEIPVQEIETKEI
jgi:CysZ protein